MKKIATLLITFLLVLGTLAACGSKDESAKTGLAIVSSLTSSTDATADEDGLAEIDSTIVAVLVDEDGKIISCKIDMAQTKINFNTEGVLTTDTSAEVLSKQELGDAYGMKVASAIGKDWYEEADAFAAYVVGKTADEVSGIAVSEGYAADEDLKSSVTIHITGFIDAVVQAVENAQDLGASTADTLGLAVTTSISDSADATADADGVGEAYSFYSAVTVDTDGKITSSVIDATQGQVNFNTTGVITSDITVAPLSKQVLKEDYGMKKASGIGKEWYEEANAFSTYVVGKTASEVSGIAVSEEGYAADADLISSVTVHVGPFIAIVQKAAADAQ